MTKKFKSTAILFLCLTLFTGCGTQKSADPAKEANAPAREKIAILMENEVSDKVVQAVNKMLQEKGFAYDIEIKKPDTNKDTLISVNGYQSWLSQEADKKEGDILFSGYGSDEVEKTYDALVENGTLTELDTYLQSDAGQKIKAAYPDKFWENAKYDGKIYGFPMNYEVQQNLMFVNPDRIDTTSLPEKITGKDILSSLSKASLKEKKTKICMSDAILLSQGYSSTDFKAIYGVKKSGKYKVEFIYDDSQVVDMLTQIRTLKDKYNIKNYQDGMETSSVFFTSWTAESGYGDQFLQSTSTTEKLVKLSSYNLGGATSLKMRNAVWGVSSWSDKKEAAVELLGLFSTDSSLANLLRYGIEGEDYTIVDGSAVMKGDKRYTENVPVNTWITLPTGAEPADKASVFAKEVEEAETTPIELGYPKLKDSKTMIDKMEKICEKYDGLWQGKYADISGTIKKMKKELGMKEVQNILDKWNEQLK